MRKLQRHGVHGVALVGTGLCLSGCLAARPADDSASQTPELSPEAFFTGSARSWSVLETAGSAQSKTFHVDSLGRTGPDAASAWTRP